MQLDLVIDPPLAGAVNMAVDDFYMAHAAERPVLRLYSWVEPTLSLGYFQSYDDSDRSGDSDLADLPVVRRVTGGGAIVHADELTYSIAITPEHPLAGQSPSDLYMWMHHRIVEAVESLGGAVDFKGCDENCSPRTGPFLCFKRHAGFDLVDAESGTLKFAGSAQRRTRSGVMQHGTVILSRTRSVQPSAALDELLGREVAFDELATALADAIKATGVELADAVKSDTRLPEIQSGAAHHASDQWLRRR